MSELLTRARAGDQDAFGELVEPHRAELLAHCYRMLGSLQDAEDTVQESLLAAWLGLAGYEQRASLRTWLFKITTNRCLNQFRSASRRPAIDSPTAPAPDPSRTGEVSWLQPFPDERLEVLADDAPGPDAKYESREAISLAFITAVQLLPPAQRAVLLLRDVLGYRGRETAELLGVTEDSVAGALKRARAALATRPSPDPHDAVDPHLLERFVTVFTSDDTDGLVELMTDDVWVRMPPMPFEYIGREAARRFFDAVSPHRRMVARLVPVGVNLQPGLGEYIRDRRTGLLHLVGLAVIAARAGRICEITHFEAAIGPTVGLPRTLAAEDVAAEDEADRA